ncbi:MAG TPA: hypothetical protein VF171_00670 [Trueperaceae bacterium]
MADETLAQAPEQEEETGLLNPLLLNLDVGELIDNLMLSGKTLALLADYRVLDALVNQAQNTQRVVSQGIGAVGQLLIAASRQDDIGDGLDLAGVGGLLKHLARESEALAEVENNARYYLSDRGKLDAIRQRKAKMHEWQGKQPISAQQQESHHG